MKLDAKTYVSSEYFTQGTYITEGTVKGGYLRKVKNDEIIPDDEWVVFRPHDTAFTNILPLYLEQCIQLGADKEHIAATKYLIDRVHHWRRNHPDKCKVPDAHGDKFLI